MKIFILKQPVENIIDAHLTGLPINGVPVSESHCVSAAWVSGLNPAEADNIFISLGDIGDFRNFFRKMNRVIDSLPQELQDCRFREAGDGIFRTRNSLKKLSTSSWAVGGTDDQIFKLLGLVKEDERFNLPQPDPIIIQARRELTDEILAGLVSNLEENEDTIVEMLSDDSELDRVLKEVNNYPLFETIAPLNERFEKLTFEGVQEYLKFHLNRDNLVRYLEGEQAKAMGRKEHE